MRLLILLLIFLVGCSTHQIQKSASDETIKVVKGEGRVITKEDYEKAFQSAEDRLEKITKEAFEIGPTAINYLSKNLFLKANEASLKGDYESSSLILKYVLKLAPEDAFVALKYAVDLIRSGKIPESVQILEDFVEKDHKYKEKYYMLLGGVYTSYKNYDNAIGMYQKAVKLNPENIESCVFLSRAYVETNKFKKGLSQLRKCEKRIPGTGVFAYYRGKFYLLKDKIKLATKEFKKSLKIESTFYQSAIALGVIYEDQGNVNQSIKVYKELLNHWGNNRVILGRLVQALMAEEKYTEVVEYANRLIHLDPSDLNLRVKLGIIYSDKGEYSKAIDIFEKVLIEVPESDKVLYYLGAIYQELDDFDSAIASYQKISEESVLFLDSSIQITQMLTKLSVQDKKREKELLGFIKERSKINERIEVELQVLKGQYFDLRNDLKRSIATISSVSTSPEFNNSQRYYLATLYDKANLFEESVMQAEIIIKNDPNNAHAYNFIGYSYLERSENLEMALKYIQEAVRLSPKDPYIRDSLGWYYFKVGKLDEALKELSFAYELEKKDSVITQHLGQVYSAMNKLSLAKDFYEKALTLSEKESERVEIKKALQDIQEKVQDRIPASHP